MFGLMIFAVFWWSFDVLCQCQFSIFDQPPIRLSDAPGSPASRRRPDTSAARVPAAPARSHLPGCSLAHLRVPSAQCLVVETQLFWITPVFVWLRCDYPSIEDFCWLRCGFEVNNWEEMKPQDWSFLVSIHPFWEDQKWFKPCFIWSSQTTSNLLRSFLENILF